MDKNEICFVNRSEWKSRQPLSTEPLQSPVDYVFIHHTAGPESTDHHKCCSIVQEIQNFHIDTRGWDDIGYSFLIGGDGRVYVGRGWDRVGAHTYMYNKVGYGISFLGNFTNHLPSMEMIESAKKLIAIGVQMGYIKEDYGVYGHRDSRVTECPGTAFYNHLHLWDRWHARGKLHKYPAADNTTDVRGQST